MFSKTRDRMAKDAERKAWLDAALAKVGKTDARTMIDRYEAGNLLITVYVSQVGTVDIEAHRYNEHKQDYTWIPLERVPVDM